MLSSCYRQDVHTPWNKFGYIGEIEEKRWRSCWRKVKYNFNYLYNAQTVNCSKKTAKQLENKRKSLWINSETSEQYSRLCTKKLVSYLSLDIIVATVAVVVVDVVERNRENPRRKDNAAREI